ncbi:MAG: Na+/H+ antiporter subunit E [Planctomycetota bacterium JB042]
MNRALALLVAIAAVWLMWSGMFVALILGFGAASCAFVVWLCHRMGTTDAEGVPLHVLPRVVRFTPWLLKEIALANLDVTRRILGPRSAISPVVFEAPSSQRSDLGRTIFANSITLTPGTVSFGVEPGRVRVHAIAREVRDGLLTGEMDRRCTRVDGGGEAG